MNAKWEAMDETKLAQEILTVLPQGSVARYCSDDHDSIQFAVQAADLKLRSVVFRRASLRRLLTDAARGVKIEYLQRDILRNAVRRAEYRYPRLSHLVDVVRGRRKGRGTILGRLAGAV
jgi:hypothetical protein